MGAFGSHFEGEYAPGITRYIVEFNPFVVTLLGLTLPLSYKDDNAPSPICQDDPRVPDGTQQTE